MLQELQTLIIIDNKIIKNSVNKFIILDIIVNFLIYSLIIISFCTILFYLKIIDKFNSSLILLLFMIFIFVIYETLPFNDILRQIKGKEIKYYEFNTDFNNINIFNTFIRRFIVKKLAMKLIIIEVEEKFWVVCMKNLNFNT